MALRYVDAFFYPDRPGDHGERLEWIQANARTRPIFGDYYVLYRRSRQARYELTEFTRDEVRSLVANRMGRLKAHLLRQ